MITHALVFTDEADARTKVPQFFADGSPCMDYVDAFASDDGTQHLMNVALHDLDTTLNGLIGAWDYVNPDGTAHLVFGSHPVSPSRVFA